MEKPPLNGVRVLDLTQAMSGPFATMLLGDLGCEVIKIEPPRGDQTRSWAPPFTNGMSSYFLSTNRNKKSICLDLKKEEGREIFGKLVKTCDILIENFRPDTMERLGFDKDKVLKLNEKLIYCSLSGFGQTGPFRDYPGYDLTVLSYSGLLSITGEEGRPPVKFGVPIADIVTGLFADVAILGALHERSESGLGQYLDLAMFDANLLTLSHQAFSYFATNENPEKLGSAHASIAPYQVFETSDGFITIAVGTDRLWNNLLESLKLSSIRNKKEYSSNIERVKHRKELSELISGITRNYKTAKLQQILQEAGIPCAPINTLGDALRSEQSVQREMVREMEAEYGLIEMLGTPFKLSRTPGAVTEPPPMLGQHTLDILRELGYSDERIANLRKNGIINSEVRPDSEV